MDCTVTYGTTAPEMAVTPPQHREVRINRVANGFIVQVGCKTFVAKTWKEASIGIDKYWKDPIKAEKEYCK